MCDWSKDSLVFAPCLDWQVSASSLRSVNLRPIRHASSPYGKWWEAVQAGSNRSCEKITPLSEREHGLWTDLIRRRIESRWLGLWKSGLLFIVGTREPRPQHQWLPRDGPRPGSAQRYVEPCRAVSRSWVQERAARHVARRPGACVRPACWVLGGGDRRPSTLEPRHPPRRVCWLEAG